MKGAVRSDFLKSMQCSSSNIWSDLWPKKKVLGASWYVLPYPSHPLGSARYDPGPPRDWWPSGAAFGSQQGHLSLQYWRQVYCKSSTRCPRPDCLPTQGFNSLHGVNASSQHLEAESWGKRSKLFTTTLRLRALGINVMSVRTENRK